MPRRILLLITDLKIGGTPTVVRELAIRLHAPPDVYVEVACLAPWGPVADQITAAGINVIALGAAGVTDFRAIAKLVRLIRERDFDTVFSFLVHANAAAAVASLFRRDVRFIQSIQTAQPNPRWHWLVQRVIHHAADTVVMPSPSVADVAQAWSAVPREKMAVIPNAVDSMRFTRSRAAECVGQPFPIGFIGRLDPVKRVPLLLSAVQLLNTFHLLHVSLHLFGEGPERAPIGREIKRLRLENVTMHGAVASPNEALAQIGLLVLPSQAEGFGLVLIEAMAAGVPVVAMNVAGVRNVVRDGVTGLLVNSTSPHDLAQAIRRVILDPSLRKQLIENGLREVRERFDWRHVIERYRNLLRL